MIANERYKEDVFDVNVKAYYQTARETPKHCDPFFTVPEITDNRLQYFVDGKLVSSVTMDQLNEIRLNIVKYIIKHRDRSILDRFYFIGHKDSNDKAGKEIKITMDVRGNLSDFPWELNHTRRSLMHLLEIERENFNLLSELEK